MKAGKAMRSFLWVAAVALLISYPDASVLKAQTLPPPVLQDSTGATVDPQSLTYSSPYGPRALLASKYPDGYEYQFHFGVDYLGDLAGHANGTPIYAVEGGTITTIQIDSHNDWYVGIRGSHAFSYLHIFNNSWLNRIGNLPEDNIGNGIYAQACLNSNTLVPISAGVSDKSCLNPDRSPNKSGLVTLEVLDGLSISNPCYSLFAIVFWQDFDQGIAKPNGVLSPCANFTIGGVAATKRVSQGDVSQSNWIALVGNSGIADSGNPQGTTTGGAHLHLQVDSGAENPLLFVQHDNFNPPGFGVAIYKDKGTTINDLNNNKVFLQGGEVLNPAQDSPLVIRTEVNYSNMGQGHDLDEVGIFMIDKNSPNPYAGFCKGAGGVTAACFDYGGNPLGPDGTTARDVFPFYPSTDPRNESLSLAVQQGFYPQPGRGGVVDFLTNPIDLTQAKSGSYLILVKTLDVLNEEFDHVPIEVEIPPKLTVKVDGNGTVSSVLPGFINCGSGVTNQVCFNWFVFGYPNVTVGLTAIPNFGNTFTGWSKDCSGTDSSTTILLTTESKNCTATFGGVAPYCLYYYVIGGVSIPYMVASFPNCSPPSNAYIFHFCPQCIELPFATLAAADAALEDMLLACELTPYCVPGG